MAELDDVVEELYGLRPDEFVPARDDAVAAAKADGDKELAKAIARLRRPTKAAWLANLLARKRGEQLDGLLSLGVDLADAQRTLDGATLRALSSQRNRLVAAMAREAGRLAYEAGDSAAESVLSDLRGILEAALADGDIADEVRSGRLARTVAYSGFGPSGEPGAAPAPRRVTPPAARPEPAAEPPSPPDTEAEERERERERERAARERAERERAERQRALDQAEADEAAALERRQADEDAREDAESAHASARDHVADLVRELEEAREAERAAAAAARTATATAKESARVAGAATTRTARARAHLEELGT